MHLRQTFLWSMIASLGLAALLGIAALLLPRYGPDEEILGSTALVAAFSMVALMCATVLERRNAVVYMWVGLGLAVAALLAWLSLIWFDRIMSWRVERVVIQISGTFTVPAVLAAQCGLLSLPRFDQRRADIARWTTIGVAALLAAYIVILIWWFDPLERMIDDDILLRALGVLVILSACGTVVTPILWKVQAVRRSGGVESIPFQTKVRVVCPRCEVEQVLMTGAGRCDTCGLRITITVEEPRCLCGYLLHRLNSDRCPECGREIRDERCPGITSSRHPA